MAQKHLKELLKEDQEPFHLKDYIADKKLQLLNRQEVVVPKTKLQLEKPKPISKTTSILCKNACFFSLQDSPDLRKSPKLFDFPASPVPNKSPNRVFLNVPAKTAALLLEAAVRIQTHKSKPNKTQIKNSGFGLFGSMLKRLTLRNRTQKIKSKTEDENRGDLVLGNVEEPKITSVSSSSSSSQSSYSSCSCNDRLSSLDLESSSSGRSLNDEDEDEFEFRNVLRGDNNHKNGDYYSGICSSPLSPFRFVLHTSPSPEHCSPAKSPVRRKFECNGKYEEESIVKLKEVEEDEEDKEQNSPVSVLVPPFEDDYDGHEEEEDDGYHDFECSYAFVHRAQQELLHRLHRFENLAEMDFIELEKMLIEEEKEEAYALEHSKKIERNQVAYELMQEIIKKSGFEDVKKPGIKRLISDLIIEEDCEENSNSEEQVIKRVCKRLESWKEVESNTIDMMVEMDLRREIANWKKSQKEEDETKVDIEVAIFAALFDELVEELA